MAAPVPEDLTVTGFVFAYAVANTRDGVVGGAASTPRPIPTTGLIWPRLDALKES